MEAATEISNEARDALLGSDVIIYGPGTQFSSLMPSYRVQGLSAAVRESRAELKTLVMNLKTDYDIRGLSAGDIIDKILEFIGDEQNSERCITHILHNRNSSLDPEGIRLPPRLHLTGNKYRNAAVVQGDFENPANSNVHSGYAVVRKIMELFDVQRGRRRQQTLDIFVDLLSRSVAFDSIVQEFLELPWRDQFCKVRLYINDSQIPSRPVPEYLEIHSWSAKERFAELEKLREWLTKGDSEYLVTLTGDGEYRLKDILSAVTTINNCSFGVLFGSRTQSRKQFATSLRAAYGEGTLLFWLSWLGAFLLSTLFAIRFQLVFSDTLTGFRIYKSSRLGGSFREAVFRDQPRSALAVARLLVSNCVEIAEMPVNYRTFRGFTKVSWRMRHAFENALGIFI